MLWEYLSSECLVTFFSKLSTLSHLFRNIFLSEKLYDIRLLWVWLPAKSPLSLQYLITSPKNDTNVGNCGLKSCAYCNPFFLNKENNKVRARFLAKGDDENFLHEYSFIFSKTSAGYTSSACLPWTSHFLLRTFILETRSHRSYANLHSQVIMWHGCGCNSTSTAWPHSDLSSAPHCWDVLLEQPHTCYHFGRALDTSVVRICCAGPTDLREFRHVLVFLTIIPVQCGITQRTVLKSRINPFWSMEKGLENKPSTWIALLHLEAHHQVMHQSGPLADHFPWGKMNFLASVRALTFFPVSVLWTIKEWAPAGPKRDWTRIWGPFPHLSACFLWLFGDLSQHSHVANHITG